jgi:hypothetical protein
MAATRGGLYEDRHGKPEYRWFWSITLYVNPMLGITTSGRAASIEEAKAQFLANLAESSWPRKPSRLSEWQRKRLLVRERG